MKFNYSIYKKIIFLALVSFLVGCEENLDLSPKTTISDINFWNNTNELEMACNYMYTFLPGLGSAQDPTGQAYPNQEMYGNLMAGSGSNVISNGARTTPATSAEWDGYYKLIRAANNILEKSGNVEGAEAIIKKYQGEAHFFRAFGHFELVKRFGDVPYMHRTATMGDPLLTIARTPRETIMDSIYADLDKAATWCPTPASQIATEYGRITSTAALALKSRIALFQGTWNKYHNLGNAEKHLQIVIQASDSIIKSGMHSLFTSRGDTSYYMLFQYEDGKTKKNYTYTSNKENILIRLYGQNPDNNISTHNMSNGSQGTFAYRPTREIVDAYLFSDGLPVGKSPLDSTLLQTSSATEHRNRDPRFAMVIYSPGSQYVSTSGNAYAFTQGVSYITRKYFFKSDVNTQTNFVNYNAIRYAEVLLNYAEAKFELNGSISDADLDLTINALRNRATNNNPEKLALISNAFVTANGLDMRQEIRRERKVELFFEGFSYWDMLRWKTAETELPKALLGPKYFTIMKSPGTPKNADGFVVYENESKRKFNPERDYLWPIPTKELALNPNLEQNPNW